MVPTGDTVGSLAAQSRSVHCCIMTAEWQGVEPVLEDVRRLLAVGTLLMTSLTSGAKFNDGGINLSWLSGPKSLANSRKLSLSYSSVAIICPLSSFLARHASSYIEDISSAGFGAVYIQSSGH